ncbi:hypothetical protein ACYSUW_07130 [Pseudomonas frederiksbergensis]
MTRRQLDWGGRAQWRRDAHDSDPNADFGTKLHLWLFFPFISEGLM